MSDEQLIIGMPAGSLADPARGGNLVQLLEKSGFKTSGYDSGGPTKFTTVNFLYGWDGRPQEFGSQLGCHELDVAIAGDDWIQERMLESQIEYKTTFKLEKVLPLKRGGVKLVAIVNQDNPFTTAEDFLKNLCAKKEIITVVSEIPYLSLDWLQKKLKSIKLFDNFSDFSVQKYKTPPRIKKGILIYEAWGKTESKIKNNGADIGIEITQSGSAIRNYDLKIIDTVMESQTSIWVNPEIKKNETKYDLVRMFLLNLYGTLNAENSVMVVFNVPNTKVKEVEHYMADNKLFADEPTTTPGKEFTIFNIQLDIADKKKPLVKIRYELAKLGATNIDTIPIISVIQSINSISI